MNKGLSSMKVGVIIFCSLFGLFVYSMGIVSSINDLKDKTMSPPTVIQNPNGGFAVLWQEIIEGTRYEPRHYCYFIRIVDADGHVVVSNKEIVPWRVTQQGDWNLEFSSKSCAWIDSKTIIIIAWRIVHALTEPPTYHIERLMLDSLGSIVGGPDVVEADLENVALVENSDGAIYVFESSRGLADSLYNFVQVYPRIGMPKCAVPVSLIKQYPRTPEWCAISTAGDNFLICTRASYVPGKPYKDIPEGWEGMPNVLICFLVDTIGTLVAEPKFVDLAKHSCRKIPGIHLGGNYALRPFKSAYGDLDLTRITSGEIILSATGLDEDQDLCVYQVRFSQDGRLCEPGAVALTKPRGFPTSSALPISKVAVAQTFFISKTAKHKTTMDQEYVFFGYDEKGNFYSKRETWKEQIK